MLRMCVLTVHRDAEGTGNVGPGEVGWKEPQHPQFGGTEVDRRRKRCGIGRSWGFAAEQVLDVRYQRTMRCLMPGEGLDEPVGGEESKGKISRSGSAAARAASAAARAAA